ncbi:MAG: hypothetical protein OXD47_00770 [Gammaproteobacteria bacterium]|nr:hypothetical protein [Gammaproteobacteria bacterium]MCY4211492.1 hypothetical protein [Gammaproteobacteria bacterium]MCY4283641.1 hypothetical protein [Gammaproteobacteria bacterium]MCY4337314.1 hypothetical protein [Gammaproteobacteria bacterium]
MKTLTTLLLATLVLAGCTDANIASHNLSKAADNFEINRRVIFYNGITDTYILTIEGRCAIDDQGGRGGQGAQLEVTCKVSPEQYKKHFLGLSDNVTYFAEQLTATDVSAYHYRVTFKPQAIKPDIDFRGSGQALLENSSESANRQQTARSDNDPE